VIIDTVKVTKEDTVTEPRTVQSTGVNSLAIVALVFAFVFAPLGIVLGHVAKRQINESPPQHSSSGTRSL
jgi:hypothetical protein